MSTRVEVKKIEQQRIVGYDFPWQVARKLARQKSAQRLVP